MPTILELKQKRLNLVTQGRAIHDLATKEKREMNAEEAANFDRFMAESDTVKAEIEKIEANEARNKRLTDAEAELKRRDGRRVDPPNPDPDAQQRNGRTFEFRSRSKGGMLGGCSTRQITFSDKMSTPEARETFKTALRTYILSGHITEEMRALQVDLDTAGGFLVTPQEFAAELIQAVDNLVFIRQRATVMTLTSATTLGVPSRDVDIASPDWTSELAVGNIDSSLQFGKRELQPHPLAKRVKISNKLLRAGALDVESIVRDRLAYQFAVAEENAFLNGNGVQQPLGVFTPSTGNGISTGRDVVSGSAGAITADGLITSKYFLKPQYWKNAVWGFHRFAIQRIRQLKDTNGQYLWNPSGIGQASLESGAGDLILQLPYFVSEYIPSTFTTGLYYGILGDWSLYWIVDALSMQLQRLVELYAEANQTGLIARAEIDGAPVLEEAFVRLQLS